MTALAPAVLRLAADLPEEAFVLLRDVAFAALQGALFVLAVWVICRLAPGLPAGWRCTLWWLAGLKLVLGLLWPAPLPLRLLPAALTAPRPIAPAAVAAGGAFTHWWAPALAAAWLLGVAFQLGAMAREWWVLRRLLQRTRPVEDQGLRGLAAGIGRRLGLPPVELRLAPEPADLGDLAPPADAARQADTAPRSAAGPSAAGPRTLPAPLIAGVLRPVVVLPAAGLADLSPDEAAMTLCHELMHARRRDLLWGWMPAIAARLFFFLPPARWAAREYALAREAACDRAVLRLLGAAPADYGRLLLRLAVAPPGRRGAAAPACGWPAAVTVDSAATVASAAASVQQLKRRIEMLQPSYDAPSVPRRRRLLGLVALTLLAVIAAMALVPLRFVPAPRPCPGAIAPASPAAAARHPG